ncbi:hypothetical protein OCU04_011857 [Sclerotinia nivalis]|uniref:Heterokaryon incompatibility domain-containing protein n=1 Tax=Sclerotinia nivalis TaxID=352851 RepID=A0A9X0ADL3_9HELO|nr:hypothetical protein OCU04_011857 [Sclerotinia nivalis]
MLSPRTIYFDKQLLWECREDRASETFPTGIPFIFDSGGWLGRETYRLREKDFESKDWKSGLQVFEHKFWHDTLRRYLSCSLTYPSDRLVAIGAIAREYQKQLNDVYLAGLWRSQLPECLLWAFNKGPSFPTRAKPYRCPTWSWASLDFSDPVTLTDALFGPSFMAYALARVIVAQVASPRDRIYTEYCDGYIRLKGRLFPIGLEDAGQWLHVDANGIFMGGTSRKTRSFLDIQVHEVECSSLRLFPIAALRLADSIDFTVDDVDSIVGCLILRTVSEGNREYERVGVVIFYYRPTSPPHEQQTPIEDFDFADDPFSEILNTITML